MGCIHLAIGTLKPVLNSFLSSPEMAPATLADLLLFPHDRHVLLRTHDSDLVPGHPGGWCGDLLSPLPRSHGRWVFSALRMGPR